ncbi:MAG TPA: peptidase [Flavobacteriaceae bacterium]|nr:peptidase [Flavobacteriaceae bacterium]
MKLTILSLLFLLFSCEEESIPKKTIIDYSNQIEKIKTFAKQNNYNQKIVFMIDYSLHSGLQRFFVVDLQKNKIIKKALVCHGSCKGENNSDYSKVFSNTNDSYCTSLGFALITERAYSKWGKNYKYWLEGLEKSNSNMKNRVVVLHAWEGVPDKSIYPKSLATSWGCPTVSINFLDELDSILKKEKKILLYSFKQ